MANDRPGPSPSGDAGPAAWIAAIVALVVLVGLIGWGVGWWGNPGSETRVNAPRSQQTTTGTGNGSTAPANNPAPPNNPAPANR